MMLLQALLLLGMVASIQGFGYLVPPIVETNLFGTELIYCNYYNISMLPDSIWRTTDCEQCECTNSGMFCEGYGFYGGVFETPEGCDIVEDACDIRLVDASDQTKDCETFEIGPQPHLFGPPPGIDIPPGVEPLM